MTESDEVAESIFNGLIHHDRRQASKGIAYACAFARKYMEGESLTVCDNVGESLWSICKQWTLNEGKVKT